MPPPEPRYLTLHTELRLRQIRAASLGVSSSVSLSGCGNLTLSSPQGFHADLLSFRKPCLFIGGFGGFHFRLGSIEHKRLKKFSKVTWDRYAEPSC
jgi:hypothetical protein